MPVIVPLIFNDKCFSMRPSHFMDKHFGVGVDLDDLFSSIIVPRSTNNSKPSAANSVIDTDTDKFQVNLDVQQFKPEEITVKVTGDNTITVEGKHEEKQDEHGFASRHFIRRFTLPKDHDINNVVSNLSSDGVLSITAPTLVQLKGEHRTIPIHRTGLPTIENTKLN